MKKLLLALTLLAPSLGWAASPTVATESTSQNNTDATNQVVTLPSTLVIGRTLVCALAEDGQITNTWPSSPPVWTETLDQNRTGVTITVGSRVIDGTEGTTVTVVASATEKSTHHCWQVIGASTSQLPEALSANNTGTTPNPPSLSPTGGSKDYLWFAVAAIQDGTNTCTVFPQTPSVFTNTGSNVADASVTHAPICWARLASTTATLDPGAFTTSGSSNWMAATIAVHPGVAVSFTAGPGNAAATDGYTVSGTLTGSGFGPLVAYAVGVSPGDGAPSCTQIKAGQNDGGTAAILAANETWTTAVGNDFLLAAASHIPSMDVHVCGSDGTNDTSVTTFSDQLRTVRSGFAFVTAASISATGLFDLDSYFAPDVAIGDVFEYEDDTNESADCNVSIGTDGDFTLTPVLPGDCDGRLTFEISYEDVSSATDGLFTAPTVGNFSTDDTVYINNSAPDCPIQAAGQIQTVTEDQAMSTIDLKILGDCTDPDGDALTFSLTSGTLPPGTSLSGTGNKDLGGTPNTENEAGAPLTFQACDPAGDCDTFSFTIYVINTWTVVDLDGLTEAQANTAVIAAAPWRANNAGVTVVGTECSSETPGTVIDQDPNAAAQATALQVIEITLAVSCGEPATERKIIFIVSSLTGLVRWTDYIPVSEVVGCDAGRYDENGCWAVLVLSSSAGKVAWVDYIPVGVVAPDATGKWRYENNGWIPVDTLTP